MGKLKYKINENGCHEVTSHHIQDNGYVRIYRNGKDIYAHRYAYEQHHGKSISKGNVVLHSCDNRCCINPDHLSEGTQMDNIHDMISKNRQRFGGSNLQECDIIDIYTSSLPQQTLADKYNIKQPNISHIKNGRIWKNITKDLIRG